MKKVISTEKLPIKMWLTEIEDKALEQAKTLANLPFTFKHVALMPDAHVGYGMPIGAVLATTDVVIPNAVGVDIGCGMIAVRTNLTEISKEQLIEIRTLIRKLIPVGFNHHKLMQDENLMPMWREFDDNSYIVSQEYFKALHQLGTLGGGNHFIEIQKGSDGYIWAMIHSGSRNIGLKVANYYNNIAKSENAKWYSKVEKESDLAFLPYGSSDAKRYLHEMNFCVDFALANRKLMMRRVQRAFISVIGEIEFQHEINIAHNYAKVENHFGRNVMVHRKGATSAKLGELGIIPGSQGSSSYIVEGLGNPDSFQSCSHGAGRNMGRKEAIRSLDLDTELGKMKDMGILHGMRSAKDLDESVGAYKDIETVMDNQTDLVKAIVKLTPLAVIKG
jgi:tRNA-splicing ligase RtcB